MEKSDIDSLRKLAQSASSQNMHSASIILAEQILNSKYALDSDIISCAKAFYDNGEPRRSLSLLERMGMLSHQKIAFLAELTRPLQDLTVTEFSLQYMNTLNSVLVASQCLFLLEQHDDCISLLSNITLLDEGSTVVDEAVQILRTYPHDQSTISPLASIYCILGKSFDVLDNRAKALQSLLVSVELDPACVEAAKYIVQNSLMSEIEQLHFFRKLENTILESRRWLLPIYRDILKLSSSEIEISGVIDVVTAAKSAEYFYQRGNLEESYRFSRHVFAQDPYNSESVVTYIASMVELRQSTELFYLGHELVKSHPKLAVSWYCIGCYYWTINKCLAASKYLQKAVKVDKRFVFAWLMLGHTLSAQEESEHAISAYRSAVRLLPNDHRPAVYMARELLRSNYAPLSLQVLLGCYESHSSDLMLLNEIGVAYLKVDKPQIAADYFEKAVFVARPVNSSVSSATNKNLEASILCNYATALRKCNKLEDAIFWYSKCLSIDPLDVNCHNGIGFTYHLLQNFQLAVVSYHKALSIQSNSKLTGQLLNQVMEDSKYFADCC